VGRLCLASDSEMLHPDSCGYSYPNVVGHHPAGRLPWVGDPPPEALQTAEACPDTRLSGCNTAESLARQRRPTCLASPIPRHYTSRLPSVGLC
jgi:hypothetical protein